MKDDTVAWGELQLAVIHFPDPVSLVSCNLFDSLIVLLLLLLTSAMRKKDYVSCFPSVL